MCHANDRAWQLDLTVDIQNVARGGLARGTELPTLLAGSLDFNTENGLWHFSAHHTMGGDTSAKVGDMQVTSNVEAFNTTRIYELWYEHQWHNHSLLAGLHDLNSEFQVLESAGLFLNSSFGVTPELSQVGPSIYPELGLGVRYRQTISSTQQLFVAFYDGVVGDPDNPEGNHIQLDANDGVLSIAEWNYLPELTYGQLKTAFGLWHHSTQWEDLNGQSQNSLTGAYFLLDAPLPPFGNSKQVNIFVQIGAIQSNGYPIKSYLGLGLNLQLPQNHTLGLAIARANTSDQLRQTDSRITSAETVFELTYSLPISENLRIQPDIQWIQHPSGQVDIDNALVFTLRVAYAWGSEF